MAMGRAGANGARGGAAGSSTGGTGGQPPPIPIPCGTTTCQPGTQSCCLQANGGSMCINAGATCPGGASIGCLEGAACGAGNFCCLSLLGGASTCAPAQVCSFAGGVILCASSAQCPSTTPNCCRLGQVGVCRAQTCR
jgi:hypothetical protein